MSFDHQSNSGAKTTGRAPLPRVRERAGDVGAPVAMCGHATGRAAAHPYQVRFLMPGLLALALVIAPGLLHSAERVWDASDAGNNKWSTAANWSGDTLPGSSDEVKITVPAVREMVMDQDFTVEGFTFLPSSNVDDLSLDLGSHTLTIEGSKGFFQSSDQNNARGRLTITGPGGALIVNHPQANFVHNNVTQGSSQGYLIMEELGRLEATVARFGIGDSSVNDRGFPQAHRTLTRLARHNVVRASFKDDYSGDAYQTAIQFFRNAPFNNGQGFEAYLGMNNEFYADSFGVSMGRAGSDRNVLQINPDFIGGDTMPTVKMRNLDGTSRMALLAAGVDANDESGISSSNRGRIDLRGAEVDILVDTVLLAVNRPDQAPNANASICGRLFMDAGKLDANVIRVGYQKNEGDSLCQGYLEVNGTGELIANDYIELGYATGNHPEGSGGYAEQGFGHITMDGGTIRAGLIRIGSEVTEDNRITMSNGANLEVQTQLASEGLKLRTLEISDSTLTIHVDGSNREPYVHVVDLLSGGAANTIAIASIENVNSFPVQIPLVAYETATPNFTVSLPDGLAGFVVNNVGNGTIDVSITGTEQAGTLTWTGSSNGRWDDSTRNWKRPDGSAATFSSGDFVVFDDTAAGPTIVDIFDAVIPGQSAETPGITVDNNAKNYTLTGGEIQGTGRTLKKGSGSLEINLISEASVIVEEGSVDITFDGAVAQATVAAGASLRSEGVLAGLISEGSSVNDGEINGPIAINGGTFENLGRIETEPASLSLKDGATVINSEFGTMDVAGGNWEIPAGGLLINNGEINNMVGRLDVGGTLKGTGKISDTAARFGEGRVSINPGGVMSPGEGLGHFTVEGRFDLNKGGQLLIEVDLDSPVKHDVIGVDAFGNIRGAIVMQNIGAKPFAIGQSFHVVSNNFGFQNFPLNPNIDFTVEPSVPGPGLAWDVSNLATNGVIAIIEGELLPPTIAVKSSEGQLTITWPDAYQGWKLYQQSKNLDAGISPNVIDWSPVTGSESEIQWNVPVDAAKSWEFFRLFQP